MKKFRGERSEIEVSSDEVVEISSDEDEQEDAIDDDKWHVFIRYSSGKRIMLEAEPSDTIKDIKEKIASRERTPVEHQKLLFNKMQLEDQRTLVESKIEKGSTIDLDLSVNISLIVTSTLKTIQLKVQRSDTIGAVQTKIKAQEGISEDQQRCLIYMGKMLEAHRTLDSYRVNDGAILHLVLHLEENSVKKNLCTVF